MGNKLSLAAFAGTWMLMRLEVEELLRNGQWPTAMGVPEGNKEKLAELVAVLDDYWAIGSALSGNLSKEELRDPRAITPKLIRRIARKSRRSLETVRGFFATFEEQRRLHANRREVGPGDPSFVTEALFGERVQSVLLPPEPFSDN